MKKMVYILIFIGLSFLTVGLYLSVKEVDRTIQYTKEQVDLNTAILKETRERDSINWIDINKRTIDRWDKIDSLHIEMIELLKNKK